MPANLAHSTRDARKRLGNIGHTKLYELIANGNLKARKIAGRTVILEADIEDFLSRLPSATDVGAIRAKRPVEPARQ